MVSSIPLSSCSSVLICPAHFHFRDMRRLLVIQDTTCNTSQNLSQIMLLIKHNISILNFHRVQSDIGHVRVLS